MNMNICRRKQNVVSELKNFIESDYVNTGINQDLLIEAKNEIQPFLDEVDGIEKISRLLTIFLNNPYNIHLRAAVMDWIKEYYLKVEGRVCLLSSTLVANLCKKLKLSEMEKQKYIQLNGNFSKFNFVYSDASDCWKSFSRLEFDSSRKLVLLQHSPDTFQHTKYLLLLNFYEKSSMDNFLSKFLNESKDFFNLDDIYQLIFVKLLKLMYFLKEDDYEKVLVELLSIFQMKTYANNSVEVTSSIIVENIENNFEIVSSFTLSRLITILSIAMLRYEIIDNEIMNNILIRPIIMMDNYFYNILQNYTTGNFSACLKDLRNLKSKYQFDHVLLPHIDTLVESCANRIYVKTISLFKRIYLNSLRDILKLQSVDETKKIVLQLIQNGHLLYSFDEIDNVVERRTISFDQLSEYYMDQNNLMNNLLK
ncbi:hypothetical protein SNEBB_005571 [Seison nebaliae]|nr:hypothetical protein SNEBB_005571 [Seison nebaliae]